MSLQLLWDLFLTAAGIWLIYIVFGVIDHIFDTSKDG